MSVAKDGPLYVQDQVTSYSLDRASHFIPKRPLQFGTGVKAVSPFQERYAFFTIAIPYVWGVFRDVILADFQAQAKRPVEFFFTKFPRPLFAGLETPNGNSDWNYVLWAMERECWPAFINHLCGAVSTDTPHRRVYRYGYQELEIVDPLGDAGLLLPTTPSLKIGAFGVRSNLYVAAFAPRPPLALPRLMFYRADPECKLYAQALFVDEDPRAALSLDEEHPREDPPASAPGSED